MADTTDPPPPQVSSGRPLNAFELAGLLVDTQWKLERAAYGLPRGDLDRAALDQLADRLARVERLLRDHELAPVVIEAADSAAQPLIEGSKEVMDNSNGGGANDLTKHTVNEDGTCNVEGCTIHGQQ